MNAKTKDRAASLPRLTLLWLGGSAVAGLVLALLLMMARQDSLENQISELKYRIEAMERRPTRLSESDRAQITETTKKQLDSAIQSLER